MGDRKEGSMLTGRRELELDRLTAQNRVEVDSRLRKASQPGSLPGEKRHADVEETVAAGFLELARGEERRRRPSLLGFQRLRRVQLRQAGGLATKLLPRLALRVVPEEPEGDQRGDKAGQRDPGEEERRKAKTQ